MDNPSGGILALVLAPLFSAIGWLAFRLYTAPRQSELDRCYGDIGKLETRIAAFEQRAAAAVDEAHAIVTKREIEYRALWDEFADLRVAYERRLAGVGTVKRSAVSAKRSSTAHRPRQRT